MSKNKWTTQEEEILKRCYEDDVDIADIYNALGCNHSIGSITEKAYKLGYRKKHRWTSDDVNLLKEIYPTEPMYVVLDYFPWATVESIRCKAKQYGLKSYNTNTHEWKPEEDKFIVENHNKMSDKEIAVELGRTFRAVKWRREKLGLMKDIPEGKYEYLRKYLWKANRQWRKDSMNACGYKCIVTGNRFDAVHHLYSSDLIVEETLNCLGLEYGKVKEYSDEQLEMIADKYAELNLKYPLGVCLTEEIHREFHNEYGYGHNTPDQFEEFIKHYYPTTHILVTTTATQATA